MPEPAERSRVLQSYGEEAIRRSDIVGIVPVIRRALADNDADVRLQGLSVLGAAIWGVGDPLTIQSQLRPLRGELGEALNDPVPKVRAAAAEVLSFGDPLSSSTERRLLDLVRQGDHSEVQGAAKALRKQGKDRRAIRDALTTLERDLDDRKRDIGLRELKRLEE
jgi:hypothetical protein